MAQIYISLGSNVERERYVNLGLDALAQLLGPLNVSSLYACEAVGFTGPEFYNLVVGAQTSLPLLALSEALRQIEYDNGRCPNAKKYSPRTLDLDLLLYDDVITQAPVILPRPEITTSAFVLRPLCEIAGSLFHPQLKQSYQQLWQDFDQSSQHIIQHPLTWQAQ